MLLGRAASNIIVLLEVSMRICRVFANARIYNAPETIYVKVADRLEAFLDNFLTTHLVFNA